MTKSFKKFREEWEDDEWGDGDDRSYRRKQKQMEKRKARRKEKYEGRWEEHDDRLNDKKFK